VLNVKAQQGPDAIAMRVRIISVNISSAAWSVMFVWFMCRSEIKVTRRAQLFNKKYSTKKFSHLVWDLANERHAGT